MRRHAQQLDRAACEEILATAPRGVLAVMGEDGYPYGVPMDFVWWNGKLYFHSAREGHKVDAFAANDKASFTVLDEGVATEGEWWLTFRSVIAFGRVSTVGDELALEALTRLGTKYFPSAEQAAADAAKGLSRVTMFEMTIDHLTGKVVREK